MGTSSLDGWLRELIDVVSGLTAGQEMLLGQLHILRLEMQPGAAAAISPEPVIIESALREAVFASTSVGSGSPPAVDTRREETPLEDMTVSQANWPTPSDADRVRSSVARNYNYFAELDKKLENLRHNGPDLSQR